jgi:TonB-linked SusC/RagA family outer membrane protein
MKINERRVLHSNLCAMIVLALSFTAAPAVQANEVVNDSPGVTEVQQATITVKGIVVDAKGQPIIGAAIQEEGTGNGAITDLNGRFTLTAKSGVTLIVSYMGYQSHETKAAANLHIVLHEDSELLQEVVVVGYGVQKKKLVTGATVQVKGEDIAKLNTVSPLGALQSQSPGVNITQVNGFVGSGFKINIRGLGTNGSYSPLFVVDGVANGSIDGLNPSDIESIDVLKDAASAAIYGARAANGVILVTTKRGKEGKSSVTYDAYVGFQNLYKIPKMLNAKEYMTIQDEMNVMDGKAPYNWSNYIPAADLSAINDGTWQGTNWIKEIVNKDALVQNHAINITGGTDRYKYAIGGSYTQQFATMGTPNSMPYMNRYNFRVNTDNVVFKHGDLDLLKVSQTLNYKYQQMQGSFGTEGIYWNGVHNMLVMSPLMHAYDSDGTYYDFADQTRDGYGWDISSSANKNPIAYLDYNMNQNKSRSHYLQTSFAAELQPIKNLRIRSQFGYIMAASTYRSYTPVYGKLSNTLEQTVDRVSQSADVYNRWSLDNTVNYVFKVGDHNVDALLGQSLEKWYFGESLSASASGSNFTDFEHAFLVNVPNAAGSANATMSGSPSGQGAISSFFGRINYNYKEKYLASVIMRADGSSTFARGHRWGYFPSVSAGWVVTEEEFMPENNWLDFLKIRASWGQNGNCSVSTFQYLSLVASSRYSEYYFGDSMDTPSTASTAYRLTNPDLKWETQETLNIGFDARLFDNRLGIEFDWYNRKTKDLLFTPSVLASLGAEAVATNAGSVKNTGFELGLHWNDQIGKDFTYGANLSLAHNKNEMTYIGNAEGIYHGDASVLWEGSEECFRMQEGYPIGFFYGYKSKGVFQNQAEIDAYQGAKLNGASTRPGDAIWDDVNNDGTIDSNDRTMIGNPHPDWTMGFSLNFSYKMVDLSVTTYGAFGQQILKCYRDYGTTPLANFTADVYNRWHGEGTSNSMPRLSSASSSNWNRVSDLYIENGDYLKIKNLTVGFDFKKLFTRLPMEQLRVYFSVNNLFTFTGYTGMDPEIGFSGESYSWSQGIDLGYYPSARTCMIGVNVKF